MNIQEMIVLALVGAAILYVASMIYTRTRSFSIKAGCSDDCGCAPGAKNPVESFE